MALATTTDMDSPAKDAIPNMSSIAPSTPNQNPSNISDENSPVPIISSPPPSLQPADTTLSDDTSASSTDTGGNKSAGHRVYDNVEIRRAIYGWMDRSTLAVVIRLETKNVNYVAKVLYSQISRSLLPKLSRHHTSRYRNYCRYVRVLDATYPLLILGKISKYRSQPLEKCIFDVVEIQREVATWVKKLPNLRKILCTFPSTGQDDTWTLDINRGKIIKGAIETHLTINVHAHPYDPLEAPVMPSSPSLPGVAISHTISLSLYEARWDDFAQDADAAARAAHVLDWKRYLYTESQLDKRVTSIDHVNIHERQRIYLSVEESIGFLTSRRDKRCEPFTRFALDEEHGIDPQLFTSLLDALGGSIRSLKIHTSLFEMYDVDQTCLQLIDKAFPLLEELYLVFDNSSLISRSDAPPLSGLKNVRRLTFEGYSKETKRDIARHLCHIGGPDTVYIDLKDEKLTGKNTFHGMVKAERKVVSVFVSELELPLTSSDVIRGDTGQVFCFA